MNEAETRAEHIDPALKAAGWGVVEGSKILREHPITPGRIEGHGKRGKALTADYVLVYRNRKLAVDEAKAWDKPLTEGVAQAKDYAGKMGVRFNTLLPGWTMTKRQLDLWVTPESEKEIDANQLLPGRVMPVDIAAMALFLASEDSKMITGKEFIVDAGWI